MASAADVPSVYDLVLSGGGLANPVGFVFLDALEPSLPFRTHRAIYSYTPTFIERSNVSGNFGDNQQDFFLTSSQRDWSEGEQQRFFRQADADSARRYWRGSAVDITIPGAVSMRKSLASITFGSGPVAACSGRYANFVSATNLFQVDESGTVNDRGAHGLGATPNRYGLAVDDAQNVYTSSPAGAAVGVRKWDGAAFSTFSATKAQSLAYLNNTLYGINSTGELIRYDTAGVAATLFTWKDASGTTVTATSKLLAFGGKLLILRYVGGATSPAELWIYDGSGTSIIWRLPSNFQVWDCIENLGIVLISGVEVRRTSSLPAVYYYANGTTGVLWRTNGTTMGGAHLAAFDGRVVWPDLDSTGSRLIMYDPSVGGVHGIGLPSLTGNPLLAANRGALVANDGSTSGTCYPGAAAATTATLTSSLFDFDSSLTKSIRAVTVEFDSATDGDGGTVDVAYRTGDVDGSYTSLATGITSGAENLISGVSGKSISIKVTLNKGTSTNGPVLKRISVRAAPILTAFRMGEYVIDCTGDGGRSPRALRDGTPNPLSGSESMAQLEIAKASTTPLTIKDRRGTYTGFIETLEGYEEHPGIDDPTRSGEFVVKLITRGV